MQHAEAQKFSLLHIFAFCTVPLACWQKWIFTFIPNYYLQHAFIYIAAPFMLWAWQAKLWSLDDVWGLLKKAAPWLIVFFLFQTVAMWCSASFYPVAGRPTFVSVLISLGKLAVQLPFILFFVLLCKVLISDTRSQKCLLMGTVAAFVFIALTCAVQALWLFGKDASLPWLAALAGKAKMLNIALAPFIEAQWIGAVYDFYSEGSYTAKSLRINGVFEEASALAAWLSTFFLPVSLGLTAVRSRYNSAGWVMAAICFVILFVSTSFAGIIFGVTGLAAIAAYFCIGRRMFVLGGSFFMISILSVLILFFTPKVQEKIERIQLISMPRVAVTIATFELIKKHPVLGVGRGWFTRHVIEEPQNKEDLHKDPEFIAWKDTGSIPHLSTLPAAAAEYGIPVIFCVMFWVCGISKRLFGKLRENPHSDLYRCSATICLFWIIMVAIAGLADIETRNILFLLPLFCLYHLSEYKHEA